MKQEEVDDEDDTLGDEDEHPMKTLPPATEFLSTEQCEYVLYRLSVREDDDKQVEKGGKGALLLTPPEETTLLLLLLLLIDCSGLAGGVGAPNRVMDMLRF